MLGISEDDFDKIYAGLAILKDKHLFYSDPISDIDVEDNYLPSKLWRLNNLYSIVDKWGHLILFKMNRSQHIVYAQSLKYSRLIILKSRQQGISTLWLVYYFDDSCTIPNLNIGLMAQGKDEASTLLMRTKTLWNELDDSIKNFLDISITKDSTTEFGLNNNSTIFIRTSFRSATLQRLHISELGKIATKYPEKAEEVKTGTLQAIAPGNMAVIESTAEGNNMFKEMWDIAYMLAPLQRSDKDFIPIFLSWLDDPDCTETVIQTTTPEDDKYFTDLEEVIERKLIQEQKNFWVTAKRTLKDNLFREYPATEEEAFLVTRQGAYWAEDFLIHVSRKSRVVKDLYDPNLDVFVAIDLGVNNDNVLTCYQYYRGDFKVIAEYKNSGKSIHHYIDWLNNTYFAAKIREITLPHDASVYEGTSGQTREERFQELIDESGKYRRLEFKNFSGYITTTKLTRTSLLDGIEQFRKSLLHFYIDESCVYLKDCILNYSREWDEKYQIWKTHPFKSSVNNGADSLRYMVVATSEYHHTTSTPPSDYPFSSSTRYNSNNFSDLDV